MLWLAALLLIQVCAFAQSRNNLSIVSGIDANLVDIHGAIGDFGYINEDGKSIGLIYNRKLNKLISLETGLLYSVNNVRKTSFQGPLGEFFYNGSVKMVSIPLNVQITFLRYLFVTGGFSLDHQTNYTTNGVISDQSGLGFEMGLGGRYNFGVFSVSLCPYFCRHGIIAQNSLIEGGARLGLGYNF